MHFCVLIILKTAACGKYENRRLCEREIQLQPVEKQREAHKRQTKIRRLLKKKIYLLQKCSCAHYLRAFSKDEHTRSADVQKATTIRKPCTQVLHAGIEKDRENNHRRNKK